MLRSLSFRKAPQKTCKEIKEKVLDDVVILRPEFTTKTGAEKLIIIPLSADIATVISSCTVQLPGQLILVKSPPHLSRFSLKASIR